MFFRTVDRERIGYPVQGLPEIKHFDRKLVKCETLFAPTAIFAHTAQKKLIKSDFFQKTTKAFLFQKLNSIKNPLLCF